MNFSKAARNKIWINLRQSRLDDRPYTVGIVAGLHHIEASAKSTSR